jgi:hypothetical protein
MPSGPGQAVAPWVVQSEKGCPVALNRAPLPCLSFPVPAPGATLSPHLKVEDLLVIILPVGEVPLHPVECLPLALPEQVGQLGGQRQRQL